jgi:hypothetical protein
MRGVDEGRQELSVAKEQKKKSHLTFNKRAAIASFEAPYSSLRPEIVFGNKHWFEVIMAEREVLVAAVG